MEKGVHHLGRQISKHTTESDRRNESRAGRARERRNTLERKGCVAGGKPERGGHERGREEGATKGGKADAWESSALSGWCST